jgi:hypothetical protein
MTNEDMMFPNHCKECGIRIPCDCGGEGKTGQAKVEKERQDRKKKR